MTDNYSGEYPKPNLYFADGRWWVEWEHDRYPPQTHYDAYFKACDWVMDSLAHPTTRPCHAHPPLLD